MNRQEEKKGARYRLEVSDEDIQEAMREIPGYLDITPSDLKEVYLHAYRHALQRIANSVKAGDLMTKSVHSVLKGTPIGDVAKIMASNGISGVPVVDGEMHVIGIISERDFCCRMGDCRAKSLMDVIADCINNRCCLAMTIAEKTAGEIMTSPVITVKEDSPLAQIKSVLAENNVNRVPVLDSSGRLVGIVSRADIVRVSF